MVGDSVFAKLWLEDLLEGFNQVMHGMQGERYGHNMTKNSFSKAAVWL